MMFSLWLQNLAAYTFQLTLLIASGLLVAKLLGLRNPAAKLAFFQLLLLITLGLPFLQSWNPVIVRSSNVVLTTHSGATESHAVQRCRQRNHSRSAPWLCGSSQPA